MRQNRFIFYCLFGLVLAFTSFDFANAQDASPSSATNTAGGDSRASRIAAKREALFKQADVKGDGKITFDEYRDFSLKHEQEENVEIAQKLKRPNLSEKARTYLTQKQERITAHQAQTTEQRDAALKRYFDRYDSNHDGAISHDEWMVKRQSAP